MKLQTKKETVKTQIRAALFAAIISVLSLIAFPSPSGIPLTLQTFAISLCGFFLGWKHGLESVLIYLTVGAIGLPVFSAMTGGLGKLFGVTGGFLFGFIPLVIFCGTGKTPLKQLLFSALGLMLCHGIGTVWFSAVTQTGIIKAALTSSLPYILKDVISVSAAYVTARLIKKRITER